MAGCRAFLNSHSCGQRVLLPTSKHLGVQLRWGQVSQQKRLAISSTVVMAQAGTNPPAGYTLKQKAGESRYEVKPEERLNFVTSSAPALLRAGTAAFVGEGVQNFKRPAKLLELYEFQGCPFCRKVREAITLLDLDVLVWPCPKDGPTYRPKAVQMSGKSQFPFLVDPNNGKQLLESDAIISYLYNEYGDGKVPLSLSLGPLTTLSAGLGQAPRLGKGISYRASTKPEKPIDIWAYEASPFCLQTREVLTELEIPHIYHSVARRSPKRPAFEAKWGVFQVPYIEDPNTKVACFETPDINKYLEDTYAVK
jgi:glutathione S-transferase